MKKLAFFALVGLFSLLPYPSLAHGEEVRIGVRVVLASHKGSGVDNGLQDIQRKLNDLFNYSSYRLLQERSFFLTQGQVEQLPLTKGRDLRLKLLRERKGSVEIIVKILREGKEIFKTKAKLKKGRWGLLNWWS